jgi:NADH dehydrogenase FAD-containing subunit
MPSADALALLRCRLLSGQELRPFVPQSTHLALITTGDKYCVATKGWFCLEVG